ncbi:hypothetical protein RhiirA5_419989 [Rhizophagus irregularis]|uniref:Uncharacterized protein n=2 Tax=Rhizophagus irregularis TaxID=588596 RepID=A0A2I1EIR0_9GLOM|nr:hypothetical protein RirG_260290 [Rhizophagus irregularis DAOM 197198w]PKC06134.1 hypothetical protein RhiirA5_419989 [Rhizophagus irregularis]PKC73472.1 hypothetical protein RhiirA1_451104 [Rhizophagus irregularis]PKY22005.1 hypothetical protein RhiirB3_435779 [Rhizophagus irregularis]GET58875.1 hypothetical protein GLOIN_2v1794797 [Rhizophagus irregularis DAOM 181602=DAOM 197198]
MDRNFIFVFILLATLTIINAIPFYKRAASFGPCLNVEDTFSVIHLSATVPVQTPSIFPVCDATGCPIFTGTEYTTSGTFLLNAALPPSYQIVLTIGNLNSSSPQKLFLHNQILACAMATITSS